MIEPYLEKHGKAALLFSGGIDSLALLEHTKDFHDKIIALYCDTGAAFPHVRQFVVDTLERYGIEYYIVKSDVMRFQADNGIPADIVPISYTKVISEAKREEPSVKVVQWTACCMNCLWLPMIRFVKDLGLSLVLRGHKKADELNGVDSGTIEDGITVINPLDDWSDKDVEEFLESRGIGVPRQYGEMKDSLDCYCCTAPLFGGLNKARKRLLFMKRYYPLQYETLVKHLDDVYGAALVEINNLGILLEEVG